MIAPGSSVPVPDASRVIVALHDGFYGAGSGTGFSNRAFLTALARLLPAGRLAVIPGRVPHVYPLYDQQWVTEVRHVLAAARAEIVEIDEGVSDSGSVEGRERLCSSVASRASAIAARTHRCLLVGLDTPLLGLARHAAERVDLLLVPRSTTVLTQPDRLPRIRWERNLMRCAAARGGRIAAISGHMRWHLRRDYCVPEQTLLSLPNGLLLDETDGRCAAPPLPPSARAGFLLATGRAVPEKGFEDLLHALGLLQDEGFRLPHLILAATTTYGGVTAYQEELADLIATYGLSATLVRRFSPAVREWLHSPALRAVVVPSRTEPFGRIPLEAFAARCATVVATDAGGLAQTVLDEATGFSAPAGRPEGLAAAIRRALLVRPHERRQLINAGHALLVRRYDYQASIRAALLACAPWALVASAEPRGGRG